MPSPPAPKKRCLEPSAAVDGKRALSAPTLPAEAVALQAALRRLRPHAPPEWVELEPLTQCGQSWAILAGNFAAPVNFEAIWQARPAEQPVGRIMGKMVTIPRWNQAYGIDYAFTGQMARAKPVDDVGAFHGLLREMQSVEPRLNSILANWYDASAGHYIGAHSDDEPQLVPGCPIVSISLCTPGHHRRFRLTPKPAHAASAYTPGRWRQEGVKGVVLPLCHGSLLIMGGATQQTHKHELMKPSGRLGGMEKSGRRVSATFRAFK